MENRSHALLAGLFLLILGVAVIGVLWWFGDSDEEVNTYVIETRSNISGLNLQGQVRYRGIRVGKVESIRLDPNDARMTLITISSRKDIPITRSTISKLGQQGLTGIAHILLEDNGSSSERLPEGQPSPVRIVMQDSLIEELADTGNDALRQARDLLVNINEILRPENRKIIDRMLANIEESTVQARATTAALHQLLSTENLQRIDAMLAHAEQAVGQAAPLMGDVRNLIVHLQSASKKIELALSSNMEGVGAMAPRIGELTAELSSASRELSSTSRQLQRVFQMLEQSPQSLIFGRDTQPGPGEDGFELPASPALTQEKP